MLGETPAGSFKPSRELEASEQLFKLEDFSFAKLKSDPSEIDIKL